MTPPLIARFAAAALLLAPCSIASADQFIADTEMAASSWSASVVNPTGGFSFNAGQSLGGGNPGAYRAIQHASASGVASGLVVHLHAEAWDPALHGGIASLVMGVDVNCFQGGTSGAVAFGLVVVQSGVVFYGPSHTPLTNSGWLTTLQGLPVAAASFVGPGSANPNFSAGAAPIQFGFYSSNGTASGTPIASSSGADNFQVAITSDRTCPADLDGDGTVGGADLGMLLGAWGARGAADLNVDGTVDGADLGQLLSAWGDCGVPLDGKRATE